MIFNSEITLGNVLQISAIAGGWIWVVSNLKADIRILVNTLAGIKERLSAVETSVMALNKTSIEIARQQVRLDAHAERIGDIEDRIAAIK